MRPWIPREQFLTTLPPARHATAVLLTDQDGRLLLLHDAPADHPTADPPRWGLPGGHLDEGETPWQCAVREVREETGLELRDPRWLGVAFVHPHEGWPASTIYAFDGGMLTPEQTAAITLSEEHDGWELRHLEDWSEQLGDPFHACYQAMLTARRTGIPCLLHTGSEAGTREVSPTRNGMSYAEAWQIIERTHHRIKAGTTHLPEPLHLPLRVVKVQEEAGEAAQALMGVLGGNPRKGVSHTTEDLRKELCDVIAAGMCALRELTPDAAAAFAEHIQAWTRPEGETYAWAAQ